MHCTHANSARASRSSPERARIFIRARPSAPKMHVCDERIYTYSRTAAARVCSFKRPLIQGGAAPVLQVLGGLQPPQPPHLPPASYASAMPRIKAPIDARIQAAMGTSIPASVGAAPSTPSAAGTTAVPSGTHNSFGRHRE